MKLAFPSFDEVEVENVRAALQSGWVTQGPFVDKFEKLFSDYQDCEHSIATTSCTAALHLSMAAIGVGPGDEVIVPAFTWITSAHCAEYMGGKAVFVDVEPNSCNIDVTKIEEKITPATKAIVAVHLFGLSADMDPILEIAKKHNLFVVEDGACALGTTYKGRMVGTIGDFGCFSFHPRKTITTGEGGMVTTANEQMAERLKSLRNHGCVARVANEDEEFGPWSMSAFPNLGFNLRLSDIQAAVGVAQFQKLEGLLSSRRARASDYSTALSSVKMLRLPDEAAFADGHAYQSYVITVEGQGRQRRNQIMTALKEANIDTRPGTHCVTMTEYYRGKYGDAMGDFPVAQRLEDETIALPLFPGMTNEDVKLVAGLVGETCAKMS